MSNRPPGRLATIVEGRAPIIEPIAIIGILSILSTWALQPFVAHALASNGTVAQSAAQVAIWLSGVIAPVAALARALTAALICWACAVYLGARLSLAKLVSLFCVAEIVFSLRDAMLLGFLAMRGVESMRSTADLIVAFGVNGFVHSSSALARVGLESWDVFSVLWAVLCFRMIRELFDTGTKSAACLALVVFASRTLFSAASLLYRV